MHAGGTIHLNFKETSMRNIAGIWHGVKAAFRQEGTIILRVDAGVTRPRYMTCGASGMDMFMPPTNSVVLFPGARICVNSGVHVEFVPRGFEIQVRPRSGLCAANGVTVLNSPGTIDSDFRGQIGVMLINHGAEAVTLSAHTRFAQIVVCRVYHQPTYLAIQSSVRGKNGFGSTGCF